MSNFINLNFFFVESASVEIHQFFLWRGCGRNLLLDQYDGVGVVQRAEALFHLRVQEDPVVGLGRLAGKLAQEADAADVLGAAGHHVAAEHIAVLGHVLHAEGPAPGVDALAVVAVRVLQGVQVEGAEVLVADGHRVGLHVVGQVLVGHAVVGGAVQVLKEDAGAAVQALHRPPPGALAAVLVAAVEDHQVGLLQAVRHVLAHVLQVHLEGGGVHQVDDLRQRPAVRLLGVVQRLQQPGGVVFDDHPLGLVLPVHAHQALAGDLLGIVQVHQRGVAGLQRLGVVFLLPLLAAQQQRLLALAEALVGQHVGDEFGLAGPQEAGDDVYGYVHSLFSLSDAEQFPDGGLVDLAADHAQAAGVVRRAVAHVGFAGHIVEVQPAAVVGGQYALGPQDVAVLEAVALVQRLQGLADLGLVEVLGRLDADVVEHLVGVMVAVVVVPAAAAAAVVVVVLMVMVMIVVVIMLVLMVVIVLMLVVVVMLMLVLMLMIVLVLMVM